MTCALFSSNSHLLFLSWPIDCLTYSEIRRFTHPSWGAFQLFQGSACPAKLPGFGFFMWGALPGAALKLPINPINPCVQRSNNLQCQFWLPKKLRDGWEHINFGCKQTKVFFFFHCDSHLFSKNVSTSTERFHADFIPAIWKKVGPPKNQRFQTRFVVPQAGADTEQAIDGGATPLIVGAYKVRDKKPTDFSFGDYLCKCPMWCDSAVFLDSFICLTSFVTDFRMFSKSPLVKSGPCGKDVTLEAQETTSVRCDDRCQSSSGATCFFPGKLCSDINGLLSWWIHVFLKKQSIFHDNKGFNRLTLSP